MSKTRESRTRQVRWMNVFIYASIFCTSIAASLIGFSLELVVGILVMFVLLKGVQVGSSMDIAFATYIEHDDQMERMRGRIKDNEELANGFREHYHRASSLLLDKTHEYDVLSNEVKDINIPFVKTLYRAYQNQRLTKSTTWIIQSAIVNEPCIIVCNDSKNVKEVRRALRLAGEDETKGIEIITVDKASKLKQDKPVIFDSSCIDKLMK